MYYLNVAGHGERLPALVGADADPAVVVEGAAARVLGPAHLLIPGVE